MFYIIIIYGMLSLASLAILLYFMKTSPFGYEDENGFHEGIPEIKETIVNENRAAVEV